MSGPAASMPTGVAATVAANHAGPAGGTSSVSGGYCGHFRHIGIGCGGDVGSVFMTSEPRKPASNATQAGVAHIATGRAGAWAASARAPADDWERDAGVHIGVT